MCSVTPLHFLILCNGSQLGPDICHTTNGGGTTDQHRFVLWERRLTAGLRSLQSRSREPTRSTPVGMLLGISCVLSTSAEGNTPKGVPRRVRGNVDAAETPSDGLMPQSHLAPFTSLHGAAHHMCACMVAEPLLLPLSLLCMLRSRARSLGHMVSDTRSRTHGLGHTASDSLYVMGDTAQSRTIPAKVSSPTLTACNDIFISW